MNAYNPFTLGVSSTGTNYCYHYCTAPAPEKVSDDSTIVIEKCERGFVLNYKDKEYACETLASAYQVMQKLFKPAKDAE